jgi:hypothetical protein
LHKKKTGIHTKYGRLESSLAFWRRRSIILLQAVTSLSSASKNWKKWRTGHYSMQTSWNNRNNDNCCTKTNTLRLKVTNSARHWHIVLKGTYIFAFVLVVYCQLSFDRAHEHNWDCYLTDLMFMLINYKTDDMNF